MHQENLAPWQHAHDFNQHVKRPGELRTIIVIAITGAMMVVEIAAGLIFGSMALLADGLHMASHAAALGINVFAYIYARRHAYDARYSFGTGKMNALGGFTGAVLLAVFALIMAWESFHRLLAPVPIAFNQSIFVAVLGLIVNGASVLILNQHDDHHDHAHHHGVHAHHESHDHDAHDAHDHHGHQHHDHEHHQGQAEDHNLRAAYLHVLADALTSLLAIFALLAAKFFGLIWMDPLMGILGALLVSRWSLSLVRATSGLLLDRQAPEAIQQKIRASIERVDDNRVADLHVWSIGPNIYSLILSVVTHQPKPPDHYKQLLPPELGLAHVTVEIRQCPEE